MKVLVPGVPIITGLRRLPCPNCQALLEITRADVMEYWPQSEPMLATLTFPEGKFSYYYVNCPECGNVIKVKSRNEN
jgi:endogenous inhibitor of DNA gyrase (YacG/DUF329 family)